MGLWAWGEAEEAGDAGFEDDFVVDDDEFFVEVELDGFGEGLGFEGEAVAFDVVEGVGADVDVEDVLENDGTLVEVFGDEVGGAAVDADAGVEGLFVGGCAGEEGEEARVDVDDPTGVGLDESWRKDAHVAGEDDQIDAGLFDSAFEPGEVGFGVVAGGVEFEGDVGGFGEGCEVGVVGEDDGGVAVEGAVFEVGEEAFEAVGFFGAEEGDAFGFALVLEDDFDFHVDGAATVEEAGDEGGEVGGEVVEVDEHVHDEEAADDFLLDVFDVDAAFGEEGGERGDGAFLVFAEDGDDGEDGGGHGLLKLEIEDEPEDDVNLRKNRCGDTANPIG